MENELIIPITNGVGSKEIANGTYIVSSSTLGYDDTSITPDEVTIVGDTLEYSFTISATGTLTLHVSDDGTSSGTPIKGAKFLRCDSNGVTYGNEIVSDANGNAVFNNIPYSLENAPIVYYKQTASDISHNFNNELQNTTLTTNTSTIEITNVEAELRTFNLRDANYNGLPISNGQIIIG